jgi:hypothetical protein
MMLSDKIGYPAQESKRERRERASENERARETKNERVRGARTRG